MCESSFYALIFSILETRSSVTQSGLEAVWKAKAHPEESDGLQQYCWCDGAAEQNHGHCMSLCL
jgi:hypothetical protein